jgi:colicin import membrane protein
VANLETNKTKALTKLAQNLPGAQPANEAAADAQFQASIGAAPQLQDTTQTAQAAGGAMAAAQTAAALQTQAQTGQTAQQIGQLGMQSSNIKGQAQAAKQKSNISKQSIDFADRLGKLDSNTKSKLLDEQLAFKKDRRQRTYFSERQQLDLAVSQSKSAHEFKKRAQLAQQISQREIHMWNTVAKKIQQEMINNQQKDSMANRQEVQRELAKMKAAAEAAARKAANKAKNRQASWAAGGTVIGAVAGGIAGSAVPGGTAAGAAAGATVGGAVGTAAATST